MRSFEARALVVLPIANCGSFSQLVVIGVHEHPGKHGCMPGIHLHRGINVCKPVNNAQLACTCVAAR